MNKLLLILLVTITLLDAKYIRDDGKGVVLDTTTRLMWQDTMNIESKMWVDSITYCENLELASNDDWYLPNVNELLSITDNTREYPSIDGTFLYTNVSSYWSSTSHITDSTTGQAWGINFSKANSLSRSIDSELYVRCVRSVDN